MPFPEQWTPKGIADLEPAAWAALKEKDCASVTAGPGAGKTEFLAQRASYLLETRICPHPYKVLAISFKTDAAKNLAARVKERCSPEASARFNSMTFDAFAKGLLDRFIALLPADWAPTPDYNVVFPTYRDIQFFLDKARLDTRQEWQRDIATITNFESTILNRKELPNRRAEPQNGIDFVLDRWWEESLRGGEKSNLTFSSINRLAHLLIRSYPQLRRALRATYPFVFVDEFQDTTHAQYSLLQEAFCQGSACITCVGDSKQKIMGWAGAMPDAFSRFNEDFAAQSYNLLFNFRSSPGLVRIQHVVASRLNASTIPTIAKNTEQVEGDVAELWVSDNADKETDYLINWLKNDMQQRQKTPRDYVLLIRQQPAAYSDEVKERFRIAGVPIRDEARIVSGISVQELMADRFSQLVTAILRLASSIRSPEAWQLAAGMLQVIRNIDPDDEVKGLQTERSLSGFISELRSKLIQIEPSAGNAETIVNTVFNFLDLSHVRANLPEYSTGDYLMSVVTGMRALLAECASTSDSWRGTLDSFEGVKETPLMTIHKAKGLEYDTVIFLGLDDKMWWAHVPGNPEGIATFFVGLSRAKQRAIFTFCHQRGRKQKVAELHELLLSAGVRETHISS